MPVFYILGGILAIILSGLYTVNQGTIVVITLFGKYQRTAGPGLRLKIPFIEKNLQTDFFAKSEHRNGIPSGDH